MTRSKKDELVEDFSAWKVPGEEEFAKLIDFASVALSAGEGLEAESSGRLKVKCQPNGGLVADNKGLAVQCGDGLTTENGSLSVRCGAGIMCERNKETNVDELKLHVEDNSGLVDRKGALSVATGPGVKSFANGQLGLDCDNQTLVIEQGFLKVKVDPEGGLIVKEGHLTLNIEKFLL
ncbi:hypothetical protein [Mycetohabitans rhizoxinica]|uniref:Adhesin domain-containing protein n=1 Tax=Mycetohabitans rhizoxinica TaxID=412963 RepID=A0ABZ2PU84_9BURK